MQEERITFETAKLAKEKGCDLIFHKTVHACFSRNSWAIDFCMNHINKLNDDSYEITTYHQEPENSFSCTVFLNDFENLPTQTLLQKWLREVHGVHMTVEFCEVPTPKFFIMVYRNESDKIEWALDSLGKKNEEYIIYETYEQALEEALRQGLNLTD